MKYFVAWLLAGVALILGFFLLKNQAQAAANNSTVPTLSGTNLIGAVSSMGSTIFSGLTSLGSLGVQSADNPPPLPSDTSDPSILSNADVNFDDSLLDSSAF